MLKNKVEAFATISIALSRGRLFCNKGPLFGNKGGLLRNKGGLLKKGFRRLLFLLHLGKEGDEQGTEDAGGERAEQDGYLA